MRQDQYSRVDSIKVKARANYQCQYCGSDYAIQAHALNGDHSDWRKGIALCAGCHADQHPNVPRGIFFSKMYRPYWLNISARELGRQFGCHPRTVIRRSKKLTIPMRIELSADDIERLRVGINPIGLKCPTCGDAHITRLGFDKTKSRNVQRYKCKQCGTSFNNEPNLKGVNVYESDKRCPNCDSRHVVLHGFDRNRNQRYKCQDCAITFY